MKRCVYCNKLIWPWQDSQKITEDMEHIKGLGYRYKITGNYHFECHPDYDPDYYYMFRP